MGSSKGVKKPTQSLQIHMSIGTLAILFEGRKEECTIGALSENSKQRTLKCRASTQNRHCIMRPVMLSLRSVQFLLYHSNLPTVTFLFNRIMLHFSSIYVECPRNKFLLSFHYCSYKVIFSSTSLFLSWSYLKKKKDAACHVTRNLP